MDSSWRSCETGGPVVNRTCTWNKAVLGRIIQHEVQDGDGFQKFIIPNPTKFPVWKWVYSQNVSLNMENNEKSMDFGLLLFRPTQIRSYIHKTDWDLRRLCVIGSCSPQKLYRLQWVNSMVHSHCPKQFLQTYWVWWLVDRDFTNDLTLPWHYKVIGALHVNSLNWPLLTCEKSHELAHAVSMKPRRRECVEACKTLLWRFSQLPFTAFTPPPPEIIQKKHDNQWLLMTIATK